MVDFTTLTAPVIKQQEHSRQTHLIIDAVVFVKVSSLSGKNVDMNVLKMVRQKKNMIIFPHIFRLDSDVLMKPNYSALVTAVLFFRGR